MVRGLRPGGVYGKPREGHWTELQGLVREIAELAPVLTGSDLDPPGIEPSGSPVVAAIKEGQRRRVLLAVNRSSEPCRARIEIGTGPDPIRVLGGEEVGPTPDGFRAETFEPLGVRVYELGLSADPQTKSAGESPHGTPPDHQ